jgi:6-pyruvoyltetrahydropterin/6-carboxytetrahydropterin synthase
MWELTKSFRFEAAHSLKGTTFGAASEEIHGHSFRAEVSVRGTPDPETGMVLDLGLLEHRMEEVRKTLDYKLLNKIDALGMPTLENISRYIFERVQHAGKIIVSAFTAIAATRAARISDRKAKFSLPSLRGAKRRSNPFFFSRHDGLPRFARNDGG